MVTPARRAGYRLFGPKFDYLLHTRPAEWPVMAAHTLVGYLLAVGLQGALGGERLGAALLGVALWVICLNGGTLAINSAYDQDEDDIAYLRRPPPPPRHLAAFAVALMLTGLLGSLALPVGYRLAYLTCMVLSVLYSVPPFRLKSVPGADWLINMWGFGTLTPYAGWAATGLPLRPAAALILIGFGPLFAALYPLTQIYQFEEDSRRGDRTLARTLGIKRSLLVSIWGAALGFALFAGAAKLAGWGRGDVASACCLGSDRCCRRICLGRLTATLGRATAAPVYFENLPPSPETA
ncbi:MAG: UbiA prenyltransferase [Geminicoccaceae bacterium]|nr:UbiA prenyltransferase [Geminicoccaceae bacterium]